MKKIELTTRAVEARINRKLARDHQKLCKARPDSRLHSNVGRYYVLDTYRNEVMWMNVNLLNFANELNVIAQWEVLKED